eukprot:jgi/Chlat1/4445/Chrsp29S00330
MKVKTLQIVWHTKEPVLTLEFHPKDLHLLVTGGADKDIKLWQVSVDANGEPCATFLNDLEYHSKTVNAVRFSPSGDLLASAGDDGELVLWRAVNETGVWKPSTMLRHYIQGVAWDPVGKFLATQSCDRSCRVYAHGLNAKRGRGGGKSKGSTNLYASQHVLAKTDLPQAATAEAADPSKEDGKKPAKEYIFHDENMPSFFRRLAWSPDGSFLVLPAGLHRKMADVPAVNAAYVYSRRDWTKPALLIPGGGKATVAVRFCPVVFELERGTKATGAFDLPYSMVFAVATLDTVFLYTTQRSQPLAILAGLHMAAITDLAWSRDARYLAISSADGYCSIATFAPDELGTPASLQDLPEHIATLLQLPVSSSPTAHRHANDSPYQAAPSNYAAGGEATATCQVERLAAEAGRHVQQQAPKVINVDVDVNTQPAEASPAAKEPSLPTERPACTPASVALRTSVALPQAASAAQPKAEKRRIVPMAVHIARQP